MSTQRPRIQAYLDPQLYDLLLGWKKQRGIPKESEALNQILREYFGMEESNQPSASPTQIEEMIDKSLNEKLKEFNLFRAEFKNEVWLQLKKEFAIWKETLEAVSNENLQRLVEGAVVAYYSHSIVDFNSRLEAVEAAVKPIEGLAEISHPFSEPPSESPSELTPFTPGTTIVDTTGNYGIVIGTNNLGMSVDWLGIGTCPNPPTGKGVWYDWKKDAQAIASFKATTHDSIKLFTTEELLEVLAWEKGQLDDYWDGKWFESMAHSIRWGGATINRWVAVVQSELPSELSSKLKPSKLNLTQLARRLKVAKSVISNRKARPDFQEWSKEKDPDGLAWQCRKEGQWLKFYSVEDKV